jgi:hypothetical protein
VPPQKEQRHFDQKTTTSTIFRKILRSFATLVLLSECPNGNGSLVTTVCSWMTLGESVGPWILSFHHDIGMME